MPKTLKRPIGSPTAIDTIVAQTPEGIPVTCGERIIASVRAGNYVEVAAGYAGIDRTTLLDWLKKGAEASRKHTEGRRLSASETRYAEFATALYVAEHEAEHEAIEGIRRMARGGDTLTTVTETTDPEGKTTKTVRRTEVPPSDRAATWHAERRWSHRWNRRQQLEVTSGDPERAQRAASPVDDIMRQLDAMERRTKAIDVRSQEQDIES